MMFGIWWLWWAIGSFGVIGTALMLWLAPTVLVEIAKLSFTFFITNRIGNIILAAALAFFIADTNRSICDRHEFAVRTAQFEQAQRQRDAQIAQETRDEVWKQIADVTTTNANIDKDVKEITDATPHATEGVNPFRVGDDSCKLRAIVGQPGCGPESHQGMPQAGTPVASPRDHKGHRLSRFVRRILGRNPKAADGHQGP